MTATRLNPDGVNRINAKFEFNKNSDIDVNGWIVCDGLSEEDFPFIISYEVYTTNAYAINYEDMERTYDDGRKWDYASSSLRYLVKQLELKIKFSDASVLKNSFHKVCLRDDEEEVASERNRLASSLRIDVPNNEVSLVIHQPNPMFEYKICWTPPRRPLHESVGGDYPRIVAMQDAVEKKVVDLKKSDAEAERAHRKLMDFLNEFGRKFRQDLADETIEAALFGYDLECRKVLAVAIEQKDARKKNVEMKWGQGVAGMAFKQAKTVLYVKSKASRDPKSEVFFKTTEQSAVDEAIFCAPLMFPFTTERRNLARAVAVVSISTRKSTSKLLDVNVERALTEIKKFWCEVLRDVSYLEAERQFVGGE